MTVLAWTDGYRRFRGRCKELSELAVAGDPTLRLVRGWYYCPIWNLEEPHWWTVRPDGEIHDPTAAQFPSGGAGDYREFAGSFPCEECGLKVAEAEAFRDGHHVFCCSGCFARCIGF